LYRGDIEEQEAIVHINGYLDILPMILELNPVPLDRSTFELIENITSRYDYVIIDAPPVGISSDVLSLNQIADAAILVIGFDMATKMDIKSSIEKMDKSGCKILGCIVDQEVSMERESILDKKTSRRSEMLEDEETLARDMFTKSSKTNSKDKQNTSYHIMEETFGKREDKGNDSEILEELLEFGLNEDDSGTDE
jgi:MinD-like ATPase involved in chromosome partitioning or flagellar assembly